MNNEDESFEYVLMTAARNEEAFIGRTIESVISQSILPKCWVIVSDNSTDRTDEIIETYIPKNEFIILIKKNGDKQRNFGSQVRAINIAYQYILENNIKYNFIGNLDADVSFEPNYFELIYNKFKEDPELGLAGGTIFEKQREIFVPRRYNSTASVAHAVHLFRKKCFDSINGYTPLRYGGSDTHAEFMARMNGWKVKSFPEIQVNHYKPTNSAERKLKGAFRQGKMDYSLGCHPVYQVARSISRIRTRPFFLYSLVRIAGFLSCYLLFERRTVTMDFIRYIREYEVKHFMANIRDMIVNPTYQKNGYFFKKIREKLVSIRASLFNIVDSDMDKTIDEISDELDKESNLTNLQ
ncbi:MAG: glycosyltransferase family 2 protein [Fibrobacter sp.]|nr:glycosyltransferase family 2 protein [Fibrobacter sp.]